MEAYCTYVLLDPGIAFCIRSSAGHATCSDLLLLLVLVSRRCLFISCNNNNGRQSDRCRSPLFRLTWSLCGLTFFYRQVRSDISDTKSILASNESDLALIPGQAFRLRSIFEDSRNHAFPFVSSQDWLLLAERDLLLLLLELSNKNRLVQRRKQIGIRSSCSVEQREL